MPCLREFHACLAGTVLRGPSTSPSSLWAVNLDLFYHINNVIMREPGWGQAPEGGRHFFARDARATARVARTIHGLRQPLRRIVRATLAVALEKNKSRGWTDMVYLRMLYGVLLLRVDCL